MNCSLRVVRAFHSLKGGARPCEFLKLVSPPHGPPEPPPHTHTPVPCHGESPVFLIT